LTTGVFWRVLALSASILCCQSLNAVEVGQSTEYGCCNGLPNISARSLPQCNTFNVFTDLLVWSAQESGTENWAQIYGPNSADVLDLSFGWDVGFRIGIDYGMSHDQWDSQLVYTWFRTKGNEHANANPGEIVASSFLGNFYIGNANGAADSGGTYQKASIQWTILFNMFDWDLGRNYWVSSALSLRPFVGVKGGWIHQTIHSKWEDAIASARIPNADAFGVATENLKNNFWGLGPSAGLNTKWRFVELCSQSFSLFGDFSGALLFGRWTFGDVYKNEVPEEVTVTSKTINGGASMLRTFMGLGWDADWNTDQFHFAVRLGYEAQFWLDQLQFYSFNEGRLVNELTLQGGAIDFRFDF